MMISTHRLWSPINGRGHISHIRALSKSSQRSPAASATHHLPVILSANCYFLFFFPLLPGTSVMSVSATDADDPTTENAILSYSIIGQESVPPGAVTKVMFGINNETGTIYTRDVGLDREVEKKLGLKRGSPLIL